MTESGNLSKNGKDYDSDNNPNLEESSRDFLTVKEVHKLLPWLTHDNIRDYASEIDPNYKRRPGQKGWYLYHRSAVIAYRDRDNGGGE